MRIFRRNGIARFRAEFSDMNLRSRRALSLGLILAVYALLCLAPLIFGLSGQAVQTWAVGVTGAVIVWYTWETMGLREIAARQAELQLRPYVVFGAEARQFSVENVGNAVALNVRIDDVLIVGPSTAIARFSERIPILRPAESRSVEAMILVDGQEKSDFLLAHLNPEYATQERPVTIRFDNAEGVEYSVTFRVSPRQLTAGAVVMTLGNSGQR